MKENADKALANPLQPATQSDTTIQPHAVVGSVNPIEIGGSVDPIGIIPDTPTVPSGAQFSLTLTLGAPPASSSTVGVYIQPVVAAGSPLAHAITTEDVTVHFNNLDVHVHATGRGAPANTVAMQFVIALLPNQTQQPIHLFAPTVTTPGQYIVSVLGHDANNNPTAGVSTTITVHP